MTAKKIKINEEDEVWGGDFEDDSFLLKKDTLDINCKQFTHMHYS